MKIYIEREKRIENFSQSVVKEKNLRVMFLAVLLLIALLVTGESSYVQRHTLKAGDGYTDTEFEGARKAQARRVD